MTLKAPFPWFGGKRRAASLVWDALGDVDHYIEPFAGSAAVLLARPHAPRCETINDADSMVANFWRAVKSRPDEVAAHCDWPVLETDLHARHLWLIGQRESLTARLIADPEWCDARIAGWWCWGACAWIGDGWCAPRPPRKLPHLGDEGRGVHAPSRRLPHLGNEGMGIHAPRRGRAFADDVVEHASVADWLRALSERLRHVRVASGDWTRVVASRSVLWPTSLPSAAVCGVFLDPPYTEGRMAYAAGGGGAVAEAARAWAIEHGDDPRLRIVLAGYEGEHAMPAGWRCVAWKANGGYGNAAGNQNASRERLWLSPHCLGDDALPLFGGGAR